MNGNNMSITILDRLNISPQYIEALKADVLSLKYLKEILVDVRQSFKRYNSNDFDRFIIQEELEFIDRLKHVQMHYQDLQISSDRECSLTKLIERLYNWFRKEQSEINEIVSVNQAIGSGVFHDDQGNKSTKRFPLPVYDELGKITNSVIDNRLIFISECLNFISKYRELLEREITYIENFYPMSKASYNIEEMFEHDMFWRENFKEMKDALSLVQDLMSHHLTTCQQQKRRLIYKILDRIGV